MKIAVWSDSVDRFDAVYTKFDGSDPTDDLNLI